MSKRLGRCVRQRTLDAKCNDRQKSFDNKGDGQTAQHSLSLVFRAVAEVALVVRQAFLQDGSIELYRRSMLTENSSDSRFGPVPAISAKWRHGYVLAFDVCERVPVGHGHGQKGNDGNFENRVATQKSLAPNILAPGDVGAEVW
jgi:hypothetical protein